MTGQERWNIVVKNWQGRVIAGRANVRSEREANRLVEMYSTDPKVASVDVVPFEAVDKQGNGRWR